MVLREWVESHIVEAREWAEGGSAHDKLRH